MKPWTPYDIPSQSGKFAIITGANSGIGRSAARELAQHGAKVILACRDVTRGEAARSGILAKVPNADVEVVKLDLADLSSARSFAEAMNTRGRPIDLLINNAGVMMPTKRKTTADGFELTLGINHLGHFALTGLLLPLLLQAPAGRVVTVASIAHKDGFINFDDLQSEKKYSSWKAYQQSKLANLLFAFELDRRLRAAAARTISVAVHPGVSTTQLFVNGPGASLGVFAPLVNFFIMLIGQSSDRGAEPTLLAATSPEVKGGKYYGPDGWFEYRGNPVETTARPQAHDQADAKRLWEISEALTGVRYSL